MRRRSDWLVLAIVYVVVAALLVLRLGGGLPLLADTDDAMRMAGTLDLLHGQPWQDTVQHRDNTPFGASMHWSRLVDAPLALLITAFGPLGTQAALSAAAIVWPLLLLGGLLAVCLVLTRWLVPSAGVMPALLLPVLALPVIVEFAPGRVDHHNVQILLVLTLLLLTLAGRTSAWAAAGAGLAGATSVAIGLETLPFVGTAALALALQWALGGDDGRRLQQFALTLGLATIGHFLLATPPAAYGAVLCDALALPAATGCVALAACLCAVPMLSARATPRGRLPVLAVALTLAASLTVALFPQCLRGPYGDTDPLFARQFLAGITEAQPLWRRFADDPAAALGLAGPAFVGLVGSVAALRWDPQRRGEWLTVLAFLAVAVIVTILQVRGARFAGALAVPGGAMIIAAARRQLADRVGLRSVTALAGSWALSLGLVHFAVAALLTDALAAPAPVATTADPRATCFKDTAFAALAALPAARVAAPTELGPHILAYTAHSVLGTAYHRDRQGAGAVLDFFNGSADVAARLAASRNLDYVVICDGMLDLAPSAAEDSFAATLGTDSFWPWLRPVSAPGATLRIFAIDHPGAGR